MKLLSVNVSIPKEIVIGDKVVATGIFKTPVSGRVQVGTLGLQGDGQADLENHGGIYKAVYSYPAEHYAYWTQELKRADFSFGQFGENLTVEGWTEDQVHIGDVFRIGSVLLEVTQPRVPCFKLAIKMNLPTFPKLFAKSGRIGFYQRVLSEGTLATGDVIERIKTDAQGMTVREVMDLMYFQRNNVELMNRAIAIPALTPGWRDEFKERLGMALDAPEA
jgi:MOSC domain-containing protein YiiM